MLSEDASWSKNVENVQIFPSFGFVVLFSQHGCSRYVFLLPLFENVVNEQIFPSFGFVVLFSQHGCSRYVFLLPMFENVENVQIFPSFGFVVLFCQHGCNRITFFFFFFASNLSSSGCNHTALLFTNKEQKTCLPTPPAWRPCSWHHTDCTRTKWTCFCDYH